MAMRAASMHFVVADRDRGTVVPVKKARRRGGIAAGTAWALRDAV